MSDSFICVTCGTQFQPSNVAPSTCPICDDDRQYIGHDGQRWTTMAELRSTHANGFTEIDRGITAIRTEPLFAIAPHAQLIQTEAGNVLWDCISLVDDATEEEVNRLGGIAAISISHPHFYTSMIEWSRAFGDVPIHLHVDNRPWVMRPDPAINFWEGDSSEILSGITAIRCGGHFPGSSVMHWAAGADGKGALFTADTINVVADRRWVSFMYSYPNQIPLNATAINGIVSAVEPYAFDRIYGSWPGAVVQTDAKAAVRRSAKRYIEQIRS